MHPRPEVMATWGTASRKARLESIGTPGALVVTAAEAATALMCSKAHIYWLIREGKLPAIHVGGLVRIRKEDLLDLIDRGRKAG